MNDYVVANHYDYCQSRTLKSLLSVLNKISTKLTALAEIFGRYNRPAHILLSKARASYNGLSF